MKNLSGQVLSSEFKRKLSGVASLNKAPCVKVDSCHEEGLEWIAGSFENRVWVPEGDLLLELVSDLVVGGIRVYFCWKIMGGAF